MKRYLFPALIFLLALVPNLSASKPLGLDWQKDYDVLHVPSGYKYYMGDLSWGQIVFIGTTDIMGMATELQINYFKKNIASALLILGPEGIDEHNCIRKYRQVVAMMKKKYGPYSYKEIEKDPVVDELIHAAVCYPVRLGLYSVRNIWKHKHFIIDLRLIGDDEGFYIEILYKKRRMSQFHKKLKTSKVLKKL